MMANHILHSQQCNMESLATIESNIRDIPQNHTTADIAHLVETHGKATSNTHPPSNQLNVPTLDESLNGPVQQLT